jgi:CRP-like cAMP-binding protein
MESLKQILSEQPFLQGLKPAHLDFIAECATEKQFSAGEYMLSEGGEANEFYLILQGKIALGTFVSGRGFTTIQTLNHNEMVGWSWLIPPYKWRFSALVIMSTQAIALDGKRLREHCEANPEFGYELIY